MRQNEDDVLRTNLQDQFKNLEKEAWRFLPQSQCGIVVASNKTFGLKRKRTDEIHEIGGIGQDDPVQNESAQIHSKKIRQEAARIRLTIDELDRSDPGPHGMFGKLGATMFTNSGPSQPLSEVLLLFTTTINTESAVQRRSFLPRNPALSGHDCDADGNTTSRVTDHQQPG